MFSDKMGFLTMMIGSFNLLNSHDVFCPNYFGLKAGACLINYIILLASMNRELHPSSGNILYKQSATNCSFLVFSRAKKRNRKYVWFLQNGLSQTRRNESSNVKYQCLHYFVNKAKI